MVTNHTPHLFKLRSEQTPEVITKILVVPRTGKFVKGEVLTYRRAYKELHSVVFIKPDAQDRDKSWVNRDGHVLSVYTYQLSR